MKQNNGDRLKRSEGLSLFSFQNQFTTSNGMTWEYVDNNLQHVLYKLWIRLASGNYFPEPVRQVAIAKKGGGVRTLGIPRHTRVLR